MDGIKKRLENYPDISFTDNMTLEKMTEKMIYDFQKKYKEETGKEILLSSGDPDRLILYAAALQLYQGFQYIERAGRQSFLKYAYGPFLDNLGALKGVHRNPGKPAVTIMRFTVSETQDGEIIIPAGTRCTAGDDVYFYTTENAGIQAGKTFTDVPAECTETGDAGNDYAVGAINILVDGIAYIGSVANTVKSGGGTGVETDENLAERIYLAPSSHAVAGPSAAYEYWAKTFNTEIEDVRVDSLEAGVVNIWFTLRDGEIPEQAVIGDLQNKLDQSTIRPLTDNVVVSAPDVVSYDIHVKYWINESDRSQESAIQENVEAAVTAYKLWQRGKIGRDINPSKLLSFIMQAGVKRAEVSEPHFTDIWSSGLAVPADQTVIFGGIEDD